MILANLCASLLLLAGARPVVGQGASAVPAAFLNDPFGYVRDGREQEVVQYAAVVAGDPATPPDVRKNVLLTAGAVHIAQGRFRNAHDAFMQILERDPAAQVEQGDRLPRPALRLFYTLRDSICTARMESLSGEGRLATDLRTIAVGDMENNSIVKSDLDMDRFAKGLVHVLMSDLSNGTSLKVVDRQRLAVLRDEIGLGHGSNLVDPETRVKFGRLSGAQTFLFGQVMLLDKSQLRMDVRWVDTATGEILLAEEVDGSIAGSTDLFKLERKLLLDVLAPRIESYLQKVDSTESIRPSLRRYFDRRQKTLPAGNAYADLVVLARHCVAGVDAANYAAAARAWASVASADSTDRSARDRATMLAAYQRISAPQR